MAFSTCLYIFIEFSTIHISIEHDFCNWQELSLFTVSRLICLSIYRLQKPVSIHEDLTCTCIYMLFICYREIYLFIHLVIDRLEWTRIHVNKPNPPSTVLFLYTTRSQMAPTYSWIHHRRDAHPWSTYSWIHHKRDSQPWFKYGTLQDLDPPQTRRPTLIQLHELFVSTTTLECVRSNGRSFEHDPDFVTLTEHFICA